MNTLLDTRTVAPADRPEYWSAGIAQHFFPVDLAPAVRLPFEARLAGGRVGDIAVCSITGGPHTVQRSAKTVARGDPDCILLYVVRSGSCRVEQDDRSCMLGPGDLATHDTSRSSTFQACVGMDVAVFSYPKQLLGPRTNGICQQVATRFAYGTGVVPRLSAMFLAELARTVESSAVTAHDAEGLREVLVATLHSLHGGSAPASGPMTGDDTLFARMCRYALHHLDDPKLGPEQIARVHFYSTRFVHKVFASQGFGVTEWIREQRMQRAMEDVRGRTDPVATIAVRWGYRDAASFSRAFRHAHGCSPSEVRRDR